MKWPGLLDRLVDFDDRLFRNIATCAPSQHLLDDLSNDPVDWAIGEQAAGQEQPQELLPLLSRPFSYGVGIAPGGGTPISRFSDGSQYGVWYGSLKLEITIYETVYHWLSFLRDAKLDYSGEVIADRRIFTARGRGLLVDLRGKEKRYPGLVHASSYVFTHAVGSFLREQHQAGLLVKSARGEGFNAGVFSPKFLSDPRHECYVFYRWQSGSREVRVDRPMGIRWMKIG